MHILRQLTAAGTAVLLTLAGMPAAVLAKGTREVLVTDTQELIAALADAQAGDEIILREGIYTNDKWTGKWAAFFAEASGTAEKPITIRSEDPARPATLSGVTQENKIVLWITGDHWNIQNLRMTEAQKGIVLDKSCYSTISGCEVYNIGLEGIHLRDDSSYCVIEHCSIHDTGTVKPQYGEGIYIGSAVGTEGYGFDCHYNTVRGCDISRVAAECIDIKEFTVGTLVEDCVFDGSCISGENGANSFIEIKGNDVIIRRNTGYRNGCEQQLYGFDLYAPLPEWGQNARIYENTLYLDSAEVSSFAGWKCSAYVFRNVIDPPDCTVNKNANRIMDILKIDLPGDADENAVLNAEDARVLTDVIHGRQPAYWSADNSELDGDGQVDVLDLGLLKQRLHTEPVLPVFTVSYRTEQPGKWRACNGLGNHTVTFTVKARPGTQLHSAVMYWDPNYPNEETGKNGKTITQRLGDLEPDADGILRVSVDLPEDAVSLALDVWDYLDGKEKLDKETLEIVQVTAVQTGSPAD